MKARGAAVQGVLAAVGLVAAYLTWQRAPEQAVGDVVVLDVSKKSIEKIRFQEGPRWIELTRRTDGSEPEIWVKQGAEEVRGPASPHGAPPPSPDAGMSMPPTVVLTPAQPGRDLRGTERAEKVFERFVPLRAVRALGAVAAGKQKELGFEGSTRRLEVLASGTSHKYKLSASGGMGAPYLLDEKDGKVYLLSALTVTELDPGSQQLVDRRLHTFKPAEFDAFTVKVGNDAKAFVQTGAETPATAKVAPKATPDKPDEFVRNWHDKIWSRLIPTQLFGRGEKPPAGEPAPMLRIEYSSRGKSKGWLELAKGPSEELFARSEHTAGWVSISGSSPEMLAEAKKVVGGK